MQMDKHNRFSLDPGVKTMFIVGLAVRRRGGRAVECGGLENRYRCMPIRSSNLLPSAKAKSRMNEEEFKSIKLSLNHCTVSVQNP